MTDRYKNKEAQPPVPFSRAVILFLLTLPVCSMFAMTLCMFAIGVGASAALGVDLRWISVGLGIVASVTAAAFIARYLYRGQIAAAHARAGRRLCQGCGYNLKAHTYRCPECDRKIRPPGDPLKCT